MVIDNAQKIIPTANVGNSVLQISKEEVEKLKNAISTAEALVNKTDATEEELDNGIKALNTAVETYKNTELNKPGENDKFNIIISGNSGYKHNDKTLTFKANNGSGGYAMGYTEDKGVFYNQAVTLTYAGHKDLYYLSINEDNGKIIYVGLGTNYDGNNLQIRAFLCSSAIFCKYLSRGGSLSDLLLLIELSAGTRFQSWSCATKLQGIK